MDQQATTNGQEVIRLDGPRFIVVEGPIGVGKTSLAKRLAQSFASELILEHAEENPFLERFYRNRRNAALPAQLFFLFQRARQIEQIRQRDMFSPVRIADFLLQKDRLFAELNLDADELALYEQIESKLAVEAPVPDLVIYLQAPTDVLARRLRDRAARTDGDSLEPSEEYLRELNEAYQHFFFHYSATPLLVVETSQTDFAGSDEALDDLIRQINSMGRGTQYYVPRT